MGRNATKMADASDLLALGDARDHEVIDGVLVQRAAPTFAHGDAQGGFASSLRQSFHRRSGGPRGPGGWWIVTEVEVELAPQRIFRPDLAGWRRERCPTRPTEWPVRLRPDWVCEILSTDESRDTVRKLRGYHQAEVPHYWMVDPEQRTLHVERWTPGGYLLVLTAEGDEMFRAEPFEAIELSLARLIGDDDDDG